MNKKIAYMSLFSMFCLIESVLVNYINNVRLNKGLYLYLAGELFLEQKQISVYVLLLSWHFAYLLGFMVFYNTGFLIFLLRVWKQK